MPQTLARYTGGTRRSAGLSFLLFVLLNVSGCCVPAPPAEAVLAGRWILPGSAIETDITLLEFSIDSNNATESVTFQIGDNTPFVATQLSGTSSANGALITVNLGFDGNTLVFDGTLDTASRTATGFITLLIDVDGITIRMSGERATLTRQTPLQDGVSAVVGTWIVSTVSSQIRESLIEFNSSGQPSLYSSQVGSNLRREDANPEGSATVNSTDVTISFDTFGSVGARDLFNFTGSITSNGRLLEGVLSLRQSGGNTRVTIVDRPVVLAQIIPPPSGRADLEGDWIFVAPGDEMPFDQLILTFNADNRLTRIVFQASGGTESVFTNLTTRTDEDGGIVVVKANFDAVRSLLFDGVIDESQATMAGYLTLSASDTNLNQEPSIFIKQ